jgi:hypothetical protein
MTQQQPPGWGPQQPHQPQQPGWGPPPQGPPPGWSPPPAPRKKHTGRNIALTVIGIVVVFGIIGALAGEQTTNTPQQPAAPADQAATGDTEPADTEAPSGPVTARAGQKVTIRDALGNAMGTITVGRVQTAAREPGAYGLEPDRGLFVATKVSAVAQRDGLQVNPFYFAVVDSSGQKYDATITGDGFGPALGSTELAKGQRTTGTVVFDTEPVARHGKIVMLDWLDQSRTIATWTY